MMAPIGTGWTSESASSVADDLLEASDRIVQPRVEDPRLQLLVEAGHDHEPDGWFRRTIGVVFIAIGIIVITGVDKQLQTWILDAGLYDPIAGLEEVIGGG